MFVIRLCFLHSYFSQCSFSLSIRSLAFSSIYLCLVCSRFGCLSCWKHLPANVVHRKCLSQICTDNRRQSETHSSQKHSSKIHENGLRQIEMQWPNTQQLSSRSSKRWRRRQQQRGSTEQVYRIWIFRSVAMANYCVLCACMPKTVYTYLLLDMPCFCALLLLCVAISLLLYMRFYIHKLIFHLCIIVKTPIKWTRIRSQNILSFCGTKDKPYGRAK